MDNTRDTREDYISNNLLPNSSLAENAVDADRVAVKFTDTGFQLVNSESDSITNRDGSNYIYAAFADTREAAYWRDLSGNANNWQPVNLDHNDTLLDSPTDNFATLNPLDANGGTISNGNLEYSGIFGTGVAQNGHGTRSTLKVPSTGKWYVEALNTTISGSGNSCMLGFTSSTQSPTVTAFGSTLTPFIGVDASVFNNNIRFNSAGVSASVSTSTVLFATYASGDIVNLAIDFSAGKIWVGKNGTWYNSGNPAAGTNETSTFTAGTADWAFWGEYIASSDNGNRSGVIANFGQRTFAYTPPSGYLALSTANLPRPAIGSDSDEKAGNYFNTVLYSGNSTTGHAITGVGFQPDLVWTKGRSDADPNYVHDVIRTVSNRLNTAETTGDGGGLLSSFDSDGFTISSTGNGINGTGHTYVAWCWRAGDSAVTNTDGTITSTVSANTTSGFSIVSYTGTGSAATVGHGLGIAPDMIIGKNRDNTPDWIVYHSSTGRLGGMFLNRTDGFVDNLNYFNDTSPTSSVFTVGSNDRVNTNTEDYIAYCFAEVEGYSKFGSYTGNGSTDGPFVYTGFKPRFIMIKASSSTSQWVLIDTARDTFNSSAARSIFANSTSAEETGNTSEAFDIVSNGFKLRSSGRVNVNGVTHIYMAFAEAPQKFSRSR
jgi:hypothetical protein